MIRNIVLLLLVLGCGQEDLRESDDHLQQKINEAQWVCYNPSSQQHGNICTEECMDPGATDKFCWLITARDCKPPLLLEWQKNSCHLLENQH